MQAVVSVAAAGSTFWLQYPLSRRLGDWYLVDATEETTIVPDGVAQRFEGFKTTFGQSLSR